MNDCIFCKIANGEIPSKLVYDSDEFMAFHDVNPVAPIHVLIIPKAHYSSLEDIVSINPLLSKRLLQAVNEVATDLDVNEDGYRLIMNSGENGGQTVPHLHFHLIAGTKLNIHLV